MEDIEFEVLSWEMTYHASLYIYELIKEEGFIPDVILAVARGGWIPGRLFADFFKLRATSNIKVEFYSNINETREDPEIVQEPANTLEGKRVLIVDDVADTGKSLKVVVDYLAEHSPAECKIATLHYKPQSILKPDYYFNETTKWIVYPWEYFEFMDELGGTLDGKHLDNSEKSKIFKKLGVPPGIVEFYNLHY